jgi:hypothetical protein
MEDKAKSTKKITTLEIVLVCVVAWLLFFLLLLTYSKKYLILGGEGNYFLDVLSVKDNYYYSWLPIGYGTGYSNPIINFPIGIFNIFSWLQSLNVPTKIINIASVSLIYVLPFSSMFWLLRKILKNSFKISFFLALFYIINPFSAIHLQSMMFWNVAPMFVIPLSFGVIYKFFLNSFKLFFSFGLLTAFLSFSFANVPYLGIFHVFVFIASMLIPYWREGKLKIQSIFKIFAILESSFIFFNLWWLANLLRIQIQDIGNFYSKGFAIAWAKYANGDGFIIEKIFSLRILTPIKQGYFFYDFYYNVFVGVIFFIPIFILIFYLSKNRKQKENYKKDKKNVTLITLFLVIFFFLSKGINNPFGKMYIWFLNNIPFFIIFKSPLEKFSLLFTFLLTIALLIPLKRKDNKFFMGLFLIYLAVCSYPFVSLNFIPDYEFESGKYISRKFDYKKEYLETRESMNKERLDYRYLILPGSLNYQVTMFNHGGNKYYRGMDSLAYSINKPFIAAYSDPLKFNLIFDNFSNSNVENILNIYNIKKVMINEDIYPAFGFKEKESVSGLLGLFIQNNELDKNGSINLFTKKDFLPHIYTPTNNIVSQRTTDQFIRILESSEWNIRSAVFFESQNVFCPTSKINELKQCGVTEIENEKIKLAESLPRKTENPPTIEYKKINPTKYRIRVHGASGVFPLVFSESFHDGWKAYINQNENISARGGSALGGKNQNDNSKLKINNYKILDGNESDQANSDELNEYIKNGWITTVGDEKTKTIKHMKWDNMEQKLDYTEKYNIDFVSDNFQGTIQNDNLPSGSIFETWFKNPIDDNKNHLEVNGYANSWVMDTDKICGAPTSSALRAPSPYKGEGDNVCVKNTDGTYDFEMVVEFWPQRLFYIGLGISGTTLLACIGYLIYDWRKRKKNKTELPEKENSNTVSL